MPVYTACWQPGGAVRASWSVSHSVSVLALPPLAPCGCLRAALCSSLYLLQTPRGWTWTTEVISGPLTAHSPGQPLPGTGLGAQAEQVVGCLSHAPAHCRSTQMACPGTALDPWHSLCSSVAQPPARHTPVWLLMDQYHSRPFILL